MLAVLLTETALGRPAFAQRGWQRGQVADNEGVAELPLCIAHVRYGINAVVDPDVLAVQQRPSAPAVLVPVCRLRPCDDFVQRIVDDEPVIAQHLVLAVDVMQGIFAHKWIKDERGKFVPVILHHGTDDGAYRVGKRVEARPCDGSLRLTVGAGRNRKYQGRYCRRYYNFQTHDKTVFNVCSIILYTYNN